MEKRSTRHLYSPGYTSFSKAPRRRACPGAAQNAVHIPVIAKSFAEDALHDERFVLAHAIGVEE